MLNAEQKYLRAIYQVSLTESDAKVKVHQLADFLGVSAPTVVERLRALKTKQLVVYSRSGAALTKSGYVEAMRLVRRHRIWETFLHSVCAFGWSEVHELAEELQAVDSEKLIDRLYELSGRPAFDPHGDPIPDKAGKLPRKTGRALSESVAGCHCEVLGVSEDSKEFLDYLSSISIALHTKLRVETVYSFDGSLLITIKPRHRHSISKTVAQQVMVVCVKPNCACKQKSKKHHDFNP